MAINVSDNNPRINYTATSGQTVFTVPFEFFASTDLTVYVGGSVLATSAYTVTGGSGSTGSITTSSGQTAGAEIAIVRDVPLERTTDLTASYSASSLNDQLDRLVTQVADLDDRVSRSISLNDYEVCVSLDLPAKASRLGKTIQFHSTTGALEVGPSGDELTSIASIASDITSLNGIKTNVTTVAGAISNVNSVGSNISSVTSVASSISNVNTVNTNIANVNSLAGSISDINDVADSLDQVELVGGSISNVDVVGAAISNVNTVAGGISNINTVAGISGNVTTVAGITSAISTVNSNATNINLVATNIDDVNDVANVITKVTTVADNIANVNTVAPSVGYLSTIANNIANINTLAPISAHITTVAGVASSVSGAAANAAAAEAAKIAAQAAQAAAELAADNFDDTYLGAKASDPTLDNDGDSLGDGDLYFNTTNNILKVYSDSAWQAAALDPTGFVIVTGSTMTGNLLFGDGNEARFGTHGDLTIEHDLNNSNIIASNNKPLNITANGGFNINSDNIYFREHAASNTYMEMRDGGGYDHAVRIFHSGTDVRLETTSTGVDITGALVSDGLTVDGAASITTGDNTAQLTLISTDADANDGPLLVLNRNSSSPADNDKVGQIQFLGEDDASNSTIFGSIVNQIKDASNGSEDGRMSFNIISAGSDRTFFNLTHDGTQAEVVVNEDSQDIDFRVESDASANALFVEGSSGNVGILTSSPSAPLHLVGSALVGVNDFGAYDKDDANLLISNGNNGTSILLHDGSGAYHSGLVKYDTNVMSLGLNNSNDTNSILTSTALNITSTGVGIGNTNPDAIIRADSGTANKTLFKHNPPSNRYFSIAESSDGTYDNAITTFYKDATVGQFVFETAAAERMRITSAGNVGIGTSSPAISSKLNVESTTTALDSGGTIFASVTDAMAADIGGQVMMGGYHTGTTTAAFGGFAAKKENATNGNYAGYLQFMTSLHGTGNTEKMRIDSSGRVGIGTLSPSSSLGAGGLHVTDRIAVGSGSAGTPALHYDGDTDTGLFFGTGVVAVSTGGTERMRIDSSGNVGIGVIPETWNGLTALQINSQASVSADSSSLQLGVNCYYNSAWKYINTAVATNYYQVGGTHVWRYAASGSADAAISWSEAMRIDSSGNLLVGTTDTDPAYNNVTGAAVRPDGYATSITGEGGIALRLNRKANDGSIVELRKDGTVVGSIGVLSSDNVYFGGSVSGHAGLIMDGSSIVPLSALTRTNDAIDLGDGSYRFDDIYATNGTINTSDRNEKQDIAELSDAEQRVAVAAKGLLRKFRWRNAVAEKDDEARTHFGIIAQDLQAAFAAEGLDAGDYAMLISSTWTDEETGEERTRMGVRYSELLAFIIAAI